MDEKKTAKRFNEDLDNLLAGKTPASEESSAEYQGSMAAARRLIETDFSAGFERKETAAEKIRQMAEKELRRRKSRRGGFQRLSRAASLIAGAALLVGLVCGLNLLFSTFVPGPGSSITTDPTHTPTALFANTEGQITVEEASSLILEWYLGQKPELNPETEIPLEERTTSEIWNMLGVQVFQVSGGNYQYETFLIHAGQVIQLGSGFGGFGVNSLLVTDLDRNGSPELVFSYSFGSGIHQSRFGLYSPEDDTVLDAGIRFTNGDLELNKVDDVTVQVFAALFGVEKELIGTVNFRSVEGEPTLTLTVEPDLSPQVLENLGGDVIYGTPISPDPVAPDPFESPSPTPTFTPTATEVFTPSLTVTPIPINALDLALNLEDLGEGWVLDAEANDPDTGYFMDRGEGGKAVIWTEQKGYPYWIDPASVESVSMRGFSQPEQKWVLFQVLVVFKETEQAEEELQSFPLDCEVPCEQVNEYEDGSGDRTTYRDPMVGDESILTNVYGLPDENLPFLTGLHFRKGRTFLYLFSVGISSSQMDESANGPVVEDAFLDELARIVEARIP